MRWLATSRGEVGMDVRALVDLIVSVGGAVTVALIVWAHREEACLAAAPDSR